MAGVAILLVGAGATAGYTYLIKGGCTGRAEATILVTPRIESIMNDLGQQWTESSPSVDGTCGAVTILSMESSAVATALTGDWDVATYGPAPDVWVPDSSAWVRKASADADAERIMPDLQPSLARTPTVIAMPRPMAEAAGMFEPLTWHQIIEKLNEPDGWATYDHEEWGPFKVGLSDPQVSTAGLLALMAISDANDDGEVSDEERAALLGLKGVITTAASRTEEFLDGLVTAAAEDPAKALTYVSAFPALEQDVLQYNMARPAVPLTAVYPRDGMAEADFPYLILEAEWADPQRQEVARAFMTYARGEEGKAAFLAAGFRDGNRDPGPVHTAANGVVQEVSALPRAILLPESVQFATASWTAVTRPTNVLLVFDTSGSMAAQVPGTGQTRLDLTKAAATNALSLLDGSARVGVWEFSTIQSGRNHRELLPLTRLDESTGFQRTHRDDVNDAIESLRARGNTGLYNTTWEACQEVSEQYVEGAANLVVLLTDGADDNNVAGLTLDELVRNLQSTCGTASKPVQVITVGLGVDSDSEVLRKISNATNAASFSSPTSFDISQVMLAALFS
ncbi:MAG TPA: substrate-binding domain-containing protein [Micromonosporaceae bacterium]|nr:substrate-binding domain-containing protein [Micromonosporaceae bacterium]